MKRKKMLFWPGIGKPETVLNHFIKGVSEMYDVSVFPFDYDSGARPFAPNSLWCKWLDENSFDWWCGISLGASLLYVMATFCSKNHPERITMINPFNSRSCLAREKGFSMNGQWDFALSDYTLTAKEFDMVISMYDEKIPLHHGIEIMNSTFIKSKRLIFIEDNHCIQSSEVQTDLANLFLGWNYGKENHRYFKYCHIYQQQGEI